MDIKKKLNGLVLWLTALFASIKKEVRLFVYDMRGTLTLNRVVVYAVGFFMVGILFPIALEQLYGANTTGWETTVKTVFQTVLPILAILGIAIDYIRGAD